MLSSYWDTGIYQPTLFGPMFSQGHSALLLLFTSPLSPATPAQPALSAPPLLSMWVLPNPKSDQWRAFRILKRVRRRVENGSTMGKNRASVTASNIFFSIFFIMTRIQYKVLRPETELLPGHKIYIHSWTQRRMTKNYYYRYILTLFFFRAHCINREFKTVNYTFSAI